jgi:methylase of polypeptide subunit release factors
MKIKDWVKKAETKLNNAGIGSAHLDALILLEDITGQDRAWLLAHQKTNLSTNSNKTLNSRLKNVKNTCPLLMCADTRIFWPQIFS